MCPNFYICIFIKINCLFIPWLVFEVYIVIYLQEYLFTSYYLFTTLFILIIYIFILKKNYIKAIDT